MEKSKIVRAFLEVHFGEDPKESLKSFVNEILDSGEYAEGFEIAIKKEPLDYQEYEELYKCFSNAYQADIPDLEKLEALFDIELPQSYFSKLSWLVSKRGEIYATDGLRVLKVKDDKTVWVTPRISWDGIKLFSLTDSEVVGEWYTPIDDERPWQSLRILAADGSLVEGEIIE